MANCPACSTDLGEDFGIVHCSGCGVVLAIDIDGNVEMSDPEGPPALEPALAITESLLNEVTSSVDALDFKVEMNQSFEVADTPDLVEPPAVEFEEFSENVTEEPPQIEEPPPAIASQASTPGAFADEIAAFGNAPTNFAEGPLHYDLTIEGIDTADIRGEIREALVDRKFVWDVDAVLRTIENGRLHVRGLTAVKAVVLIQRLATIPVQVSWEQHAIFEG